MFKPLRLGVALGGGAARGVSHIGVLEVLEDAGLTVDIVSGTSMGALVGAAYLIEGSAAALHHRLYEFVEGEAFRAAKFDVLAENRDDEDQTWLDSLVENIRRGVKYSYTVTRQSIIERDVYDALIGSLIPDIDIEDLPKPFAAASLDVVTGQEVIWTGGSLRNAVSASCAIPGIFPPLELDGQILVDGGWTRSVPVLPARKLGADMVAAVDISRVVEEILEYKRGVSIMLRSAMLTSKHLRQSQIKEADWVISPRVGDVHWADFQDLEHLVHLGREAALPVAADMRKKMSRGRITGFLKRIS